MLLQDGENIVTPKALSYDSGGTNIMAALHDLKEDQQKSEDIAKAGHELVRRALRPENVRR